MDNNYAPLHVLMYMYIHVPVHAPLLKGQKHEIFDHCFFHKLTPYGPLIHTLKCF
jgi:hypothetical protein